MTNTTGIYAKDGQEVLDYKFVQDLRDADRKAKNPYQIIAQRGGQENILQSNADIIICGGCRGGSKTFSLLMETLKDVNNKHLRALIMRHDIKSLDDVIDTSSQLYNDFGTYNRSKNDMSWYFDKGGMLKFSYHEDVLLDFIKRFRGHQYAYIGVDEVTQMDYAKFKFLITCNRNAFGIKNRFVGTCNPDPDSWVAPFIDWWIGEDGFPIPERDAVVRYCFMDGDDVTNITWGDTREEVYNLKKDVIDRFWKPEMAEYGKPEDLFIKSVAFIEAKLIDNIQLMRSDPTYLANLAGQSEEQRSRDLEGNWKFRSVGEDIIKMQDFENFFNNAYQYGDNIRRCSCDVAFEGGDRLVMWLWIGYHIHDVFSCKMDAKGSVVTVKAKLQEWNVLEENFTYDLNGLGQIFKGFFPHAIPFNNLEAVAEEFKYMYGNIKSQAAYMFAQKVKNGELSINQNLLDQRYSGKRYENARLRDILQRERKSIKADDSKKDKGFILTNKYSMIRIVGHSPDWIEAMYMRFIFDIKKKKTHQKPRGILNYVSPYRYY